MEYIISGIANVVVFIIEAIISFFANSIITPINGSMNLFLAYFKTINDYYIWIQVIGIMIAVGIFTFQCFKSMFYQYSASQTDSVPIMFIKLVIAIGAIVSIISISKWVLEIGTYPTSQAGLFDSETYDVVEIIDSVAQQSQDSANSFTEEIEQKNTSFLNQATSIFAVGSGIGVLAAVIVAIALVVLGWKLIKLLLEILERYVLLNVILLLSPLAIGTAISRSTVSVFRKFLEMLVSTFLLLFLNLLFLRIILSSMYVAFSMNTLNYTFSNGSSPNVVLSVFIISAMITITTSLDQHISKLVVTGTTGKQLGIGGFLASQVTGGLIRGGIRKAMGGKNTNTGNTAKDGNVLGGKGTSGTSGASGSSTSGTSGTSGTASLPGSKGKNSERKDGAKNQSGAAELFANKKMDDTIGKTGSSVFNKIDSANNKDLYSAAGMIGRAGDLVRSKECKDLTDATNKVVKDALNHGNAGAAGLTALGVSKGAGISLAQGKASSLIQGFEKAGILPSSSGETGLGYESASVSNGKLSFAYTDSNGNMIENVSVVSASISGDEIGSALESGKDVYSLAGDNDFYAIVDGYANEGQSVDLGQGSEKITEWVTEEAQKEQFEQMTGDTPLLQAPPDDTPSADTPPADTPPADTPPADTPPADGSLDSLPLI